MKNLKNFKSQELNRSYLTNIYGGYSIDRPTSFETPETGKVCDIHRDSNEDGDIDEGECIDFVKCN